MRTYGEQGGGKVVLKRWPALTLSSLRTGVNSRVLSLSDTGRDPATRSLEPGRHGSWVSELETGIRYGKPRRFPGGRGTGNLQS